MKIIKPGKITITQNRIEISGFTMDNEGGYPSKKTYTKLVRRTAIWAIFKIFKEAFLSDNLTSEGNHFKDEDGNFMEAP
jgi:hypothetical protein